MSDEGKGIFDGEALVSGREMASEWMARRQAQADEADKAKQPEAQKQQDYSKNFEQLQSQIAQSEKANAELRGALGEIRQSQTALQNWIAEQSRATQAQSVQRQDPQQGQQEPFEPTGNAALDAALNTMAARMNKQAETMINGAVSQLNRQNYEVNRNNEAQRVLQAVSELRAENPDFKDLVTDKQIMDFAKPMVDDARYHGRVNWKNELTLMSRTMEHPKLQAQLAEKDKKIQDLEKQIQGRKQQQSRDLSKVPGTGRGGNNSSQESGELGSIGDRIMNSHRTKFGRRSTPSWENFGNQVVSAISRKYSG